MRGFTLVEIIVVVGITALLTGISIPVFYYFQSGNELLNSSQEIVAVLRLAQNKTLSSEGASSWGVFFSTTSSPNQYVLFKGQSYASRNASYDEVRNISSKIEIASIDLQGLNEAVFQKVTGQASSSGSVLLRQKSNPSNSRTIHIESAGLIGFATPTLPSDSNRIKDSRHVHFSYSRTINTGSETITLVFPSASQNIAIAGNLAAGQIFWEGQVNVLGQMQKIKIQTHSLNNPDVQFSVHRDKRYNTRPLNITISGDPSGNLISYDASGQTTQGNSIYVSSPTWQ